MGMHDPERTGARQMPRFYTPAAGVEGDVNFDFTTFVPLPHRIRHLGYQGKRDYPGPTSVEKLRARLLDFGLLFVLFAPVRSSDMSTRPGLHTPEQAPRRRQPCKES